MHELTKEEQLALLRKMAESKSEITSPSHELEEKANGSKPKSHSPTAPKKAAPKPVKPIPAPVPREEIVTPRHGPAPLPFSEDALACQFTARHGATFRHIAKWGRWFQWTGSVWHEESTALAFDLARRIARDNMDLQGVTEPIKKTLSQASTVAAIVKMASADRQHAVRHDIWDRHSMKLNTTTGTVDLTTGELFAHNPLDYHTKIAATGPSNETPHLWLEFMNRIFDGDEALISYIRRCCGYCLTGNTTEHALFFCYGTGANGKSTFTRTLSGILCDYCREAALETFTETKNEQHPTALAGLKGARLALIRETPKARYWDESQLKACTGGDKVTARGMRQDFFDYQPEFKLLCSGNHKPHLRSVDEAMRRRMNLIPFAVTIPERERDLELFEKLKDEWGAILNWMLEGCLEWQQTGLKAPACVLSATSSYMEAEDKLGLWLAERCIVGPKESAGSTACYTDWKHWCEKIGEEPGSQRAFSQELMEREGIRQNKDHSKQRGFTGISVKPEATE
jgi:putative DNA primase/helicase